MSYDKKIIDQKYHLKGLINNNVCTQLIKFYEANKHMAIKEDSYKFYEDSKLNNQEYDNYKSLNISNFKNNEDFQPIHNIILKYLRIVLVNHEIYLRNNFCSSYQNIFLTHTDNLRIIKYEVGQFIKDHSDVAENIRGSLTINLNNNYEGGDFRFFGGQVTIKLDEGEAMLFPAEPLWIHGTEPITKGSRYTINCFLKKPE